MTRKRVHQLAGVAGGIAGALLIVYAVFTSKSSTAPVGLILVPFFAAAGAAVGVGAAFTGFVVADLRGGRLAWLSRRAFVAAAMVLAAIAWGSAYASYRSAISAASDPGTPPEALSAIPDRWLPLWRDEVLAALARNPSSPSALLVSLTAGPEADPMLQLVGAHPSVPPEVIASIAAQPRSYARDAGLAGNPRIPADVAEKFERATRADFRDDLEYKLYQTYVLGALARNPSTPKPVFERLAARENPEYFLAIGIIQSPQASCAQIARAGEGGSDVLRATAQGAMRQKGC